MALVSTDDRHYKNIAQAIRNKLGTEELLLPEQMAGAINSIGGFMKNYQGTTIHADDTYYCNMVANRNKIEVLGQTIQNCLDHSSADKFSELQGTIEDGYIKIVADGSSPKVVSIKKDNGIIKPSTVYTFVVEILENTLTGESASIVFENRVSSSTCFDGGLAISPVIGKKGVHKLSFTSKSDIVSGVTLASACAVTLTSDVTGSIKFRYAIVEGDWTSKEISFVPFGLNYPETTEVVATGKNLFNGKIESGSIDSTTGQPTESSNALRSVDYILINGFETYILTDVPTVQEDIYFYDVNKNYISVTFDIDSVGMVITPPKGACYCKVRFYKAGITLDEIKNVQMEIGSTATEYEPYIERKVNINYPLASISDTIRDRYFVKDGKKYHEQVVKEIVLDGSEDERWNTDDNNSYFYAQAPNLKYGSWILCDKAYFVDSIKKIDTGSCMATSVIVIGANRTTYPTLSEWRAYIAQNPYTVLYQLETPIITEIETEDWYSFDGQTNITTINTVKPTLDIDIPTALVINSGKEM